VVFEAKAFADPSRNLMLMSEMRHGLKAGELALHYQPKLALADGAVASAEALVRWAHPDRGAIGPADFIRIAEETGNIRPLTEWALEAALADQAALAEGGVDLRLAVNVSGRLLGDRDFRRRLLRKAGGKKLMLEISEAAVVENPRMAAAAIAAFREAGLRISIDNYGAGLSSLNHLKMLHAHELKLDRALTASVVDDRRDRLVVKSAIDLAHSLGMAVVAEGVEEEAVRRALTRLDCDMLQGFLVAKPMPAEELQVFLTRARRRRTSKARA
jgi:EAL domain-containing protein (putative c-di-GMP-specific phosphodiesterase class I)